MKLFGLVVCGLLLALPLAASGRTETVGAKRPDGKVLVVYFTPANNDAADAVSSATPRVDGEASIAHVARQIASRTGADLVPIVAAEAYPEAYQATADRAKEEQDRNARPAFSLAVDPEAYDVVFVGYPIWWYRLPMVMQSFFDTYDFTGKTLVPFNTHAGSRDGGTYAAIASLEPGAKVKEGLAVAGSQADRSDRAVREWLASLGY